VTWTSLDWERESDKKWTIIFIVKWTEQQTSRVSTFIETSVSLEYFFSSQHGRTCLQITLHASWRCANLWATYQIICPVLHKCHCDDVTSSFHVNSCSFVETYWHFGGIYCLHLNVIAAFYRNPSTHPKISVSEFVIRCSQVSDYFHFSRGRGGENVLVIIII